MLAVGVPEITPLLKIRPLGKAGLSSQVFATPPETDGVSVTIVTPLVNTNCVDE